MARGPNNFKQRDVSRALRAAMSAGIEVERFEIDQAGRIVVFAEKSAAPAKPANEWDSIK